MTTQHPTRWHGEPVVLDGRHALWRPSTRELLVADVHVGKSELFRREGLPVPPGDLDADLARLSELVGAYAPDRLVVLGDWVHHREGLTQPVIDTVSAWRREVATPLVLVRGNHERTVARMPASWSITEETAPLVVQGWSYTHEPDEASGVVVCGHVHPAVRVGGLIHGVRLPCFWGQGETLVLPSFGRFTGGHTIHPKASDVVVACVDGEVIPVATSRQTPA